jgi:hypothetical protein
MRSINKGRGDILKSATHMDEVLGTKVWGIPTGWATEDYLIKKSIVPPALLKE